MSERGLFSTELLDRIATEGTLAHTEEIPEDIRGVFVCAHDISPEWHVKMQAAFQRHCDASISKTINFPESAAVEDVDKIYRDSFSLRCKGVTVYRDGCRKSQPMALKDKKTSSPSDSLAKKPAREESSSTTPIEPATLPEILSSVRIRQMTPFGNMHIQITVDPSTDRELEVFAQLGKGGDVANSDLEAICRMISLWLRGGGSLKHVIQQLKGIGSSLQVSTKDGKIMSLGDGLARALTKYTRAKTHFGVKSLLLGAFEQAEMDRVQRGLAAAPPKATPRAGNGAGKNGGHSHATVRATVDKLGTVGATSRGFEKPSQAELFKVLCPECQSALRYSEGCCICHSCGYSHC